MTWIVSITDDEILLEYHAGENHVIISLDEDGPGYCVKQGDEYLPGRFELGGNDFMEALADIRQACTAA